ncbi:MAG: hypothetical protein JWQ71_3530 [Pedosphaera sp.]|nr:hypothetical protein [Pedosphaera sp.]
MPKKYTIEFIPAKQPIRELITKFGGQPNWISEPEWPLSKSTGKPMQFIGQFTLDPELFGGAPDRMAYLFMTNEEDAPTESTWEPNGGENAVIIQPGGNSMPTISSPNGPALQSWVETSRSVVGKLMGKPSKRVLEDCEFGVKLVSADDPEFLQEREFSKLSKEECEEYLLSLRGNKLGGTPEFIQGPEFPFPDSRKLLLQLDSGSVPFEINFGDAGVGYVFLSADGSQAKFLWQCG